MAHVHHLQFSPDGHWLAACGGSPTERGELELFRWPPGEEPPRRFQGGEDVFFQIVWSPSGDGWLAANGDGRLYRGRLDAEELATFAGHSRRVLSVARAGDLLISGGVDRSVRVWREDSMEPLRSLNNHTGEVRDLAVRPAAESPLRMLASAGADRTVRLWQPRIGRLVRFARLPIAPLDIDWSPDGSRLLAACEDGRIRILDPDTVEIEATLDGIPGWAYTLVVAPPGDAVLVGGAGGALRRVALPPPGR
jgi:WD40 repeat protein